MASNQQAGTSGTQTGQAPETSQQRPKSETGTMTGDEITAGQNHVGAQIQTEGTATLQRQESKSEGTQAGGTLQQSTKSTTSTGTGTRSKDYGDECSRDAHDMHHNIINNNARRSKSKSTEDMNVGKTTISVVVSVIFRSFYSISRSLFKVEFVARPHLPTI